MGTLCFTGHWIVLAIQGIPWRLIINDKPRLYVFSVGFYSLIFKCVVCINIKYI